ncbi:tRNA (guanine(10)-N2)-dimethyltransferase [uncultured archaeon]|nr:tRNA (guanine(10)-N2)-dimethyltransferase [uncultured archaeon]
MEYFFILGRNPQLSYAELQCYFESRGIKFDVMAFERNYLLLSFEKEIKVDIQEFGGVVKVGKILYRGNDNNFGKFLENYIMEIDKFSFCVTGSSDSEELEEALMEKFKHERIKAQVRHGRNKMLLQKGEYVLMPNADVEFFFYKIQAELFFGRVEQDYSYTEVKERDMHKPFRRESLAISPRLSKILVNITQVKPGQLLLDPFCGVAGIIQEALLKGVNCYGIDKDKDAIESAKKNLKWLSQNYKLEANYTLLNADSKNAPNIRVDGVATEPALGEIVRRKLRDNEAKEFIERFERMIVPVLKRIVQIKKPGARIAITLPYIREHSVNIAKVCQMTGLKKIEIPGVESPIKEVREGQFIAREIVVLS